MIWRGLCKPFLNQKGDGTTILFTTLNMVLLAFFIVLNSIAVPDDARKRSALGSLLGTLGILPGGLNPGKSFGNNTIPPSSEYLARDFNVMEFIRKLEKFSMEKDIADEVILNIGKENILIVLSGNLAFVEGEAKLKPRAVKVINSMIPILSSISGEVNIAGHTDDGSHALGPYPDDWTLSYARAGNAARLIVLSERVRPRRIAVSGYGATRPILREKTPVQQKFRDRLEINLKRERYL
jgi:chemotaxis protein MotB